MLATEEDVSRPTPAGNTAFKLFVLFSAPLIPCVMLEQVLAIWLLITLFNNLLTTPPTADGKGKGGIDPEILKDRMV